MRNIKFILRFGVIILVLYFMLLSNSKAQIPPVDDPAWIIKPSGSCTFTGTSLNTNFWWGNNMLGHGLEYDTTSNLLFTTGTSIKIEIDTMPNTMKPRYNSSREWWDYYLGGAIVTNDSSYKYGYLEIYAKYPTGGGNSYWPGFWLWASGCYSLPKSVWYNEIDIGEQGGIESENGSIMGTDWHVIQNPPDTCGNNTSSGFDVTGLPLLSSSFHKYAVEWTPDKMIWYFDNVPVRTDYEPTLAPKHHMYAILDFYVYPHQWGTPYTYPYTLPAYFEIAYMNYYKLDTACSSNITICNPSTDYSSRAVEESITVGSISCNATFNTSDEYTLRATDYVLLKPGTTINANGSGHFAIIPTACPK